LLNYQAIPDLMIIDLYHLRGAQIGSAFWATLPGKLRVVALCRPEDPPDMIVALQGGVGALLTRESDVDELLTAVRTASKGGVYLSPELTGPLIVNNIKGGSDYRCLAPREIETLRLVAEGLTHRQISRRMGLSESTVSTYVKQIRTKLRAGNKADLTRAAIDLGYIGSVIQNSRS
jgi:DNA-binding NarL/FixJ family response regulator